MMYDIPPSGIIEWPVYTVYPGVAEVALSNLRNIFSKIDPRTGEDDTKSKAIEPILNQLLQFPEGSYHKTTKQIYVGGRGLKVDYSDSNEAVDFIIEAKDTGTNLAGPNRLREKWNKEARVMEPDKSKFSSPLDQGLTYLDEYNANACIITNGFVWYIFKKGKKLNEHRLPAGEMYFGLRFRIDRAEMDGNVEAIRTFIQYLHFNSVTGQANRVETINYCEPVRLARNLSSTFSDVLLYDFSGGPLEGHGVGFRQWKDD